MNRQANKETGDILVVDDSPDIRQLLRLVLVDDGHQVRTAQDGLSALEAVSARA